jgi:hypothetical protein
MEKCEERKKNLMETETVYVISEKIDIKYKVVYQIWRS